MRHSHLLGVIVWGEAVATWVFLGGIGYMLHRIRRPRPQPQVAPPQSQAVTVTVQPRATVPYESPAWTVGGTYRRDYSNV